MKTTLTIEESARLIELGVDAKLASCSVIATDHDTERLYYAPCFSIADILSILPKEIEQVDRHPMTIVYYWSSTNKEWVAYYDYTPLYTELKSAPELIDALFSLLVWAIETGYVKTDRQ